MGINETPADLGDAAALTPSLFLGHYLYGIHHIVLSSEWYLDDAVRYIDGGGTVLTSDPGLALAVMARLGLAYSEALEKLHRADHVLALDHPDIRF